MYAPKVASLNVGTSQSRQLRGRAIPMIRVRYFEGALFRKSTISTNPKVDPNLTLTLTQTIALRRISAQWIFGISDLRYSRPSE